jgi:hypothetical protein
MKTTFLVLLGAVTIFAVGFFIHLDRVMGSAVAASAASDSAQMPEGSTSAGGELDAMYFAQTSPAPMPSTDGAILSGEYGNSLIDRQTGMTLYWQNDNTNLYVGLVSPGTGWAGVGFSHRTGKPGSNIIIGAVSDGRVTMRDGYGITKSLHATDKVSSLLAIGGSESDGQTTLEFVIPLDSADSQDVALAPGETVQVILAYQATKDSLTTEHTRYGMTQIVLDPN